MPVYHEEMSSLLTSSNTEPPVSHVLYKPKYVINISFSLFLSHSCSSSSSTSLPLFFVFHPILRFYYRSLFVKWVRLSSSFILAFSLSLSHSRSLYIYFSFSILVCMFAILISYCPIKFRAGPYDRANFLMTWSSCSKHTSSPIAGVSSRKQVFFTAVEKSQ